jgi:hypothetical protein
MSMVWIESGATYRVGVAGPFSSVESQKLASRAVATLDCNKANSSSGKMAHAINQVTMSGRCEKDISVTYAAFQDCRP